MTKKIGLGILLAVMASAASAAPRSDSGCSQPAPPAVTFFEQLFSIFSPAPTCGGGGKPMSAPEIDPSSALAGLTLMGAGLTVLRGRRTRKH